jgi:hypothetical protein
MINEYYYNAREECDDEDPEDCRTEVEGLYLNINNNHLCEDSLDANVIDFLDIFATSTSRRISQSCEDVIE